MIRLDMKSFRTMILAFILLTVSCAKEDYKKADPDGGDKLTLTADGSGAGEIILDERNTSLEALSLNWTTGTNYGTGNAIDYRLEIAQAADEYADGFRKEMGRRVYNYSFTVEELNTFVIENFNAEPWMRKEYKARVTASVADKPDMEQTSEVSFAITPYEPVTSTLYMIGGATPYGWSADNAAEMKRKSPGFFTWTGILKSGELKFITTLTQFWPAYVRDGSASDNSTLKYFASQPSDELDLKFNVEESGGYIVTADLLNLTLKIAKTQVDVPPYQKIYFVSEANGWSFIEMTQDPVNPFIFRYGAEIGNGQFKFGTTEGSWENMYKAAEKDNADITSTGVIFVSGTEPDNKWMLYDDVNPNKPYKIALDITPDKESMTMSEFKPYETVWMVGDATPNGWDLAKSTPLEKNGKYTFTWTGNLTAGEIKFTCDRQDDWNGAWFMAGETDKTFRAGTEVITFVDKGNEENKDIDRKWKVSEAGNYTITLDQLAEKMTVVKN